MIRGDGAYWGIFAVICPVHGVDADEVWSVGIAVDADGVQAATAAGNSEIVESIRRF